MFARTICLTEQVTERQLDLFFKLPLYHLRRVVVFPKKSISSEIVSALIHACVSKRIEALHLDRTSFPQDFSRLSHLRVLEMRRSRIDNGFLDSLPTTLHSLTLRQCSLRSLNLTRLTELKHLDIAGTIEKVALPPQVKLLSADERNTKFDPPYTGKFYQPSAVVKLVERAVPKTPNEEQSYLELKALLDDGLSPDLTDSFSSSLLYYAAAIGSLKIAQLLQERGARIDSTGFTRPHRYTALKKAVLERKKSVVKYLLGQRANPLKGNCVLDTVENTPLHRLLFEAGATFVLNPTQVLNAALCNCSSHEYEPAQINFILNQKHPISDLSFLFTAVIHYNLDALKRAYDRRLNLSVVDKSGNTLLHQLCNDNTHCPKNGSADKVAQFLISRLEHLINTPNAQEKTPIFEAVINRRDQLALLFARHGASLDVIDPVTQNTLLHHTRSKELAEFLLVRLPHLINLPNKKGQTPLHTLLTEEFPFKEEVTVVFLNFKANLSSRDINGQTPLHCAINCRDTSAACKLLTAGANPHALDLQQRTPLSLFLSEWSARPDAEIQERYWKVFPVMIQRAAQIDPITTFALAIYYKAPPQSAMTYLLSYIAVRDQTGNTPLHLAVQFQNYEWIESLSTAGADPDLPNMHQQTPRALAAQQQGTLRVIFLAPAKRKWVNFIEMPR